jgi:hypothetical protein
MPLEVVPHGPASIRYLLAWLTPIDGDPRYSADDAHRVLRTRYAAQDKAEHSRPY